MSTDSPPRSRRIRPTVHLPALIGEDAPKPTPARRTITTKTAPARRAISPHPTIQLGQWIFAFRTFDEWVNHATHLWHLHRIPSDETLCVDAKGRVCTMGKHFMIARDDGAFPIGVYWLRSD